MLERMTSRIRLRKVFLLFRHFQEAGANETGVLPPQILRSDNRWISETIDFSRIFNRITFSLLHLKSLGLVV